MIERIFHFNINSTNLDRSLAFYQLLGFHVIVDFREGMASREMADAFGIPTANLKGVHLRLGDGADATRIDLLEFTDRLPKVNPTRIFTIRESRACVSRRRTSNGTIANCRPRVSFS